MVVRPQPVGWIRTPALAAPAGDVISDVLVVVPWHRRRILMLLLAVGLAGSASAVLATGTADLNDWLIRAGDALVRLRWPFLAPVLLFAATHYAASAVGLRAAAGVPMRFGTTVAVQLAAAAANRLTVAGIGAAAVNTRYLTRSGLRLPAALSSMTALGMFGLAAKTLTLLAIVFAGSALGLGDGTTQLTLVGHHLSHMLAPLERTYVWGPILGLAAVLTTIFVWRGAHGRHLRRFMEFKHGFWAPVRALLRDPRRLALLTGASAGTTLMLGFAFIACTHVVAGVHPSASLSGLLIAYMLGGAVGTATPLPGGLGATEAALTAMLVANHVPASHALQVVLLFRVVTFWLPAVIGLLASRQLVRRRVL
ncbi:MAG TPA: lysylphosphatidylglycerol synthase transmembrane domain-containing protein [Jatrophihabitans sp.]|jgi:uncharacterized membrane protein YbhN (UPF0104 family)